jgi:hypothetical protein
MGDSSNRRHELLSGVWIAIATYAIFYASISPSSPFLTWMQQLIGAAPSHSPQSYLIKYVSRGACAAIGLFVILGLSAVTWRKWPHWTRVSLIASLMTLPMSIVYAFALLRRCLLMIDSTQAQTLIRDDSLTDRSFSLAISAGCTIAFVVLILNIAYGIRKGRSRSQEVSAGTATG